MGAGASVAQIRLDENQAPQLSAEKRSLGRGKLAIPSKNDAGRTLKVVLNNDGSRLALIKYLERRGLSPYLDFYFEVEGLRKKKKSEILEEIEELKLVYDANSSDKNGNGSHVPTSAASRKVRDIFLEYVKSTHAILALEQMYVCQSMVIDYMVEILGDFMDSSEYRSWEVHLLELDRILLSMTEALMDAGNMHGLSSSNSEKSLRSSNSAQNIASKYYKILLVDDSNVASKLISKALRQAGYVVDIASDGRLALDLLSEQVYDVILIDLFMPIMDGFQAVVLFRELEIERKSYQTLVIGMSGDGSEATVARAMKAGVNVFLEKPFAIKKFNKILLKERSN